MTAEQASYYGDQQMVVAALVRKLERQRWLSLLDQQRMLCAIQNMRMICDSTFLFDKETKISPKLDELKEILRELVIDEDRKVVIFSEWEKMNLLMGELLDKMKIGYVSLHGAVPTRRRGALIAKFHEDPNIKAFLSTDAGGVGINLQVASAVINIEPPWNPARLEQRIARVHRMGQSRPVLAVHLLTENSIEERVWETIRLKKALFQGLFDGASSEVSFEKLSRRNMLETLKEIVVEEVGLAGAPDQKERDGKTSSVDKREQSAQAEAEGVNGPGRALGTLLEAGLQFLESLSPSGSSASAVKSSHSKTARQAPGTRPAHNSGFSHLARNIETAISPLIKKASVGDRAALNIPLPSSLTAERIAQTITAALSRLMGG